MEKDNLLFFRLRSLRSRKRIIRKDLEKQIIKKHKRSQELWKIRRDTPLVPLEPPYQKGFVRFFVVSDDVKRSKDGGFFEGLLEKINTEMYSEIRRFLQKKRKSGRRIYVERKQELKRLSTYDWNNPRLGLTAGERTYFLKKEEYDPFRKQYHIYYECIEPWRFVLKVKPNIITHYKPLDADVEREYDELESYLQRHRVVGIVHKKIYGKPDSFKKKYKRDPMNSRKCFHCKKSATAIAEDSGDANVLKL